MQHGCSKTFLENTMNKNFKKQLALASIATIATAFTACTDGGDYDSLSGVAAEPPAIAENTSSSSINEIESSSSNKPVSSSSEKAESSSSSFNFSSSSQPPVACKPGIPDESGRIIGCAIINPTGDYTWNPNYSNDGTRFEELGENVGYWYDTNDNEYGGKSAIEWPAKKDTTNGHDDYSEIMEECGGLCGTAAFNKGTATFNPFVGIGFGIGAPIEGDTNKFEPKDISNWDEICVLFNSDEPVYAHLVLTDSLEDSIKYDDFKANLQKGGASAKCVSFNPTNFKKEGWGNTLDFDVAIQNVTAIQFTIQGQSGKKANFAIKGISINLKDDE